MTLNPTGKRINGTNEAECQINSWLINTDLKEWEFSLTVQILVRILTFLPSNWVSHLALASC